MVPSLVWGCRTDGTCDYVNRRWLEYTGLSENELLGYSWLHQVHPADREMARDAWRTSLAK